MKIKAGIDANWLITALQNRGIAAMDILNEYESTETIPSNPHFLPTDIYLQLFNWGAEQTADTHLGVSIAREMEFDSFGVFGSLMQSAATVGGFLQLIEQYQAIFMLGMGFSFERTGHHCTVKWNYWTSCHENARQDIEFSLAVLVKFIRQQMGEQWSPDKVSFSLPYKDTGDVIRHYFGEHCEFNQAANSISFGLSLLDVKLIEGDSELLIATESMAKQLLEDAEQAPDLLKIAKLLIATGRNNHHFSIETVANQLNMTSRTLRRHLKKSETSFRQLCDEVILDMAKKLLHETEANITVIAQQLGFSEASAFVRAFKRLTGMSPSHYREQSQ